jgi:hypothetical protein
VHKHRCTRGLLCPTGTIRKRERDIIHITHTDLQSVNEHHNMSRGGYYRLFVCQDHAEQPRGSQVKHVSNCRDLQISGIVVFE